MSEFHKTKMKDPKPPRALTSRQERRLVNYLDESLLDITRNYNKRTEPSSTLQTLSAYLDSMRTVLTLILQIPPIDPSTGLRIAYLLRFTGDVLNAIPSYKLASHDLPAYTTLQDLIDFLDDLDQAWVAVLQNQVWAPDSAEGVDLVLSFDLDLPPESDIEASSSIRKFKSTPPSQTDLARLRSLLFSGESALEEWLSVQRNNARRFGDEDAEDISAMLAGMGLLDQFNSLFIRTLDYLGAFSGDVARNFIEPQMEVMM